MSVRILSGVNELTSDSYVGRSIGEVRQELRVPLSISDGATVFLNGERHDDQSTVLRNSDSLEFTKESGSKGA